MGVILFKLIRGEQYTPTLLENALENGDFAEIRMDADYIYIPLSDDGVEKSTELLKSFTFTDVATKLMMQNNCYEKILKEIDKARDRIIINARKVFMKYGLEIIDFAILE